VTAATPPIDLRLLSSFVALADEGNFGRTARSLHLSPSSLSQQIKSLEASWGVTLFTRGARGAVLTPEGARLLAGARRLVAGASSYRDEVVEVADGLAGTVRLGFVEGTLGDAVVAWLRTLRRDAPDVRLVSRGHRRREHALRSLRAGWHDAAVVVDPPDDGLDRVTLARVPYVVVVPSGDPLWGREAAPWTAVVERSADIRLPPSLADVGDAAGARGGRDGGAPGRAAGRPGRSGAVTSHVTDTILDVVQHDRPALLTALDAARHRLPDVAYLEVTGDDAPVASVELVWRAEDVTPSLATVVDVARRHAAP